MYLPDPNLLAELPRLTSDLPWHCGLGWQFLGCGWPWLLLPDLLCSCWGTVGPQHLSARPQPLLAVLPPLALGSLSLAAPWQHEPAILSAVSNPSATEEHKQPDKQVTGLYRRPASSQKYSSDTTNVPESSCNSLLKTLSIMQNWIVEYKTPKT